MMVYALPTLGSRGPSFRGRGGMGPLVTRVKKIKEMYQFEIYDGIIISHVLASKNTFRGSLSR